MKKSLVFIACCLFCAAYSVAAQEKGVDNQSSTIRDAGNGRTSNGSKQDVGSGRGINFGADKTPDTVVLANPYRLNARRDALLNALKDILQEERIIIDDDASRLDEGFIVTQPYVFAKGAVITQGELSRNAQFSNTGSRGWTRGRHTLTIEILPLDGTSANVSIYAKIEGRSEGLTGTEWVTLTSSGAIEQRLLGLLAERITGTNPAAPQTTTPPQK